MKKMILGLGALTAVITPVAFAADCGGKSSKTVLVNAEHTGTGTSATNTQQAQALNSLDSKIIIQGNTIDVRPYEVYVQLQLVKEFGDDAFKNISSLSWSLSQDLRNKINTKSNELNKFLLDKLFEFMKNNLGQPVIINSYKNDIKFPQVTQQLIKSQISIDNFNVWLSSRGNSLHEMNNLVDFQGSTITLTRWSEALINKLKQDVSPTADWFHLTLEQYVKYRLIINRFFNVIPEKSLDYQGFIMNEHLTFIDHENTKTFDFLGDWSSIFDNLFTFYHFAIPIPTA